MYIPWTTLCTSLLFIFIFILLFIKSQYTVFCTSYCFAHLIVFALFIPLHILLLFLFFYHIYALVLCYFYIILIFISVHLIWLHFTSNYTLYNLLCDKIKKTLNLDQLKHERWPFLRCFVYRVITEETGLLLLWKRPLLTNDGNFYKCEINPRFDAANMQSTKWSTKR